MESLSANFAPSDGMSTTTMLAIDVSVLCTSGMFFWVCPIGVAVSRFVY